MITDPSWLYSTIAQSSAAIVAIIGGFITATVLMLTAEKRSLTNQRKDKEVTSTVIEKQIDKLTNMYETREVNHFLAEELAKYPDDDIPTLEKILASYPTDYGTLFNKDILEREFLNLTIKQIEAKLFVLKHADKIDIKNYDSFLKWVEPIVTTEKCIEIGKEYNKYIERQEQSQSASNEAGTLSNWIPLGSSNIIQNQCDRDDRENNRYQIRQANIASMRNESRQHLSLLKAEIRNLTTRLESFSYPPNLWLGLGVLGFLTVFCIFWPVLVIANEAFSNWSKILIIGSFYLGILLIFVYVVKQIVEIRR